MATGNRSHKSEGTYGFLSLVGTHKSSKMHTRFMYNLVRKTITDV
jgi:hypothetical protein